ncbi:MAG: hypothetical protein A2X05_17475 [Bacteroidetes bacterium GWE2_41_25]|nr:MAG: hypothetical protein A2X03_00910 [Bacteroidetes bacterium GWA2_40_15]OFX85180.1 MAG: hypothetical protein A2X06_12325 [Bacteroidetes bacterium GWC2_40_22]OFX96726.1 MAG: hypothetical protein A2X05_17475 [Bacteroidetes bacterium GWE2_41_25]OFY61050.1 MAG: hypothetical protein A2X04_12980 [Bacteroidetes bacterium GWF2_41_9]HBH83160.1 hypothetical protein [Bacteroidales bacterium]
MDQLFYNLSEEEFTKGRKVLLWIFAFLFLIAGLYVLTAAPIFGHLSIHPILSVAPFGISFVVLIIALLATIKRKDLFFLIDEGKIEFRYGIFRPKRHSFKWTEIKEMVFPSKQRKIKLILNDGTSYVIELSYIQRKKSTIIRQHIYHAAHHNGIKTIKVMTLK